MSFTAVKGTAGVYGEQQKCIQSSVFVCNNPESQFCLQKMEDAAINKYSCNFPAAILSDSFFFSLLKITFSLPSYSPAPRCLLQKHMQSIFMSFHQSSLISLRLNPQPDNAWRRPVLYGSIRLYSSLRGKWSVGNVMYMALGVQKPRVFRWPYWCLWPCGLLQSHMCKYIHSNTR